MIQKNYILKASAGHVSSDLLGEVVILSIKNGKYYGLNDVGAQVWNMLQMPIQFGDIINSIVKEYDVSLDQCETDLVVLLEDLLKEGLIKIEKAD